MNWALFIILLFCSLFFIVFNFDFCTNQSENCFKKDGACIGEYLTNRLDKLRSQKCFGLSFKKNLNIHIISFVIFIIYTILLFSLYNSISTVTGNKIFVFFYCVTLIAFFVTMYCVPYIPNFIINVLSNIICLLGPLLIPILIIFFGYLIWRILDFFGFTISIINGILLLLGALLIYFFVNDDKRY